MSKCARRTIILVRLDVCSFRAGSDRDLEGGAVSGVLREGGRQGAGERVAGAGRVDDLDSLGGDLVRTPNCAFVVLGFPS